jgi:hypothetical protein
MARVVYNKTLQRSFLVSIPLSSRSPLYQKAWHTQRRRALGQEPFGENLLTLRAAIAQGGDAMEAIADWSKVILLLSSSDEVAFESAFDAVQSRGIEPSFLVEEALLTGHNSLLLWLINKVPMQALSQTPASTYGVPQEYTRHPRAPDYVPANLMTLFLTCQSRPVIEAVLDRGLLDPVSPQPYAVPGLPQSDSAWKEQAWTPLALAALVQNKVLFDTLLAHPAVSQDARSKDEALIVVSAPHGKTPYQDREREIRFEWTPEEVLARLQSLLDLGANPETPFERTVQYRQGTGLMKTAVLHERAATFWMRSTLASNGPAIGRDGASPAAWNAFFIRQAPLLQPESWVNRVNIIDHPTLRALSARKKSLALEAALALTVRSVVRFQQEAGMLVSLCSEANEGWMLDWWSTDRPPFSLESLGEAVLTRAKDSVLGAHGDGRGVVTPSLTCKGLPLGRFGVVLSGADQLVWQETVHSLEESFRRYVSEGKSSQGLETQKAAIQAMSMAFALPQAPTSRPKVRL